MALPRPESTAITVVLSLEKCSLSKLEYRGTKKVQRLQVLSLVNVVLLSFVFLTLTWRW